jgi:predicted nucleic acid-binding protein
VILVDTNVLVDVLGNDAQWSEWSEQQLDGARLTDRLAINDVIYAELSIAFARAEELENVIAEAQLTVESIPRAALFLAGKVYVEYRRAQGQRRGVLPDFIIGAHAAVMRWPLLTRDARRYRRYFPTVQLMTPDLK